MRSINRAQRISVFFGLLVICTMPGVVKGQVSPSRWVSLSLDEAVALAIGNSLEVRLAELDRARIQTRIQESKAPFDTLFELATSYEVDESEGTSTVQGSRSTEAVFDVGLEKKFTTGTTVELDWTNSRTSSNSSFRTINPAFTSGLGVSLTQALGQNFGGLIDRAQLRLEKLTVRQDDLEAIDRVETAVADTLGDYWQLVFAKERLRIRQGALDRAESLARTNEQKRALGLIEDPELFASQANVKLREEQVWVALNALLSARRTLNLGLDLPSEWILEPSTTLGADLPIPPRMSESLTRAMEARRDLRQAYLEIEVNRLEVKMAANERLPTIDLTGSFQANGLDVKYSESLSEVGNFENPTYSVELAVSWPLENRAAKAIYRRRLLEKAKALIRLYQVQRQIAHALDDQVRQMRLRYQQVTQRRAIEELYRNRLRAEERRYRLGRSNVQNLVDAQVDVLQAEEAAAEALRAYRDAWIGLRRAEHTLLTSYGYIPRAGPVREALHYHIPTP